MRKRQHERECDERERLAYYTYTTLWSERWCESEMHKVYYCRVESRVRDFVKRDINFSLCIKYKFVSTSVHAHFVKYAHSSQLLHP